MHQRSEAAPGASHESEERLRILADNLPNGMIYQLVASGDERRFLYLSRGVEGLFGVDRDAALADPALLYGRFVAEDLPRLVAAEGEALARGGPFRVEARITLPDGSEKWLQLNSAPRTRADGVRIWDGIALDITDRKRAELGRVESEQRLAIATEAAAIGIWDWNLVTNEMSYSARAKEICGFPLDQPVTYPQVRDVTHPADLPRTSAMAARATDPAIRSDETFSYRLIRADTGETRWVVAHGRAFFSGEGPEAKALSYTGTIQDVTEQKQAEDALAESEARLRLAIGAGKMAVWELDPATDTISASPELNALYGFPPDANPPADAYRARYAPGERERLQAEGAAAMSRGETQLEFEVKHLWPDGTIKWLAIRAQLVQHPSKGVRVIGVALDITERRLAEDRMMLVARELQHRVKNSLAVVQTLADQTFKGRATPEAMHSFAGRLQALAAATEVMTRSNWADADIAEVVAQITRPYRDAGRDPFIVEGPSVPLRSKLALAMGMAVHELSTNAVKYGALSASDGRVHVTWSLDDRGDLRFIWRETGGPPVAPPTQRGFGTRLLQRGLFDMPDGQVELIFEQSGVTCVIALGRIAGEVEAAAS